MTTMTTEWFEDCINRLKVILGVNHDQDVAKFLGLTKGALVLRKRRMSFPEKELRLLAAQMDFDAEYVLHGGPSCANAVCDGEALLLSRYRAMSPEYRKKLLGIAAVLVKGAVS